MDTELRLVADFNPDWGQIPPSWLCCSGMGIAPDSRYEGCVSSQRWERSWAKGSSHGAVSTDWNGEKTLQVPGARQCSSSTVASHAGRAGVSLLSQVPGVLLQPDRRLWPLWQLGDAHCGFWAGSGWGLFPDCDGQGFANSCWRHHFPARHSMSWDLWLCPQSRLIRSNHS